MARDVDLVIRARDSATAAITTIGDAMKQLAGIQTDVGQSAQKTDTLLGQLGNQIRKLTQESKSVTALGQIADQIEKAGKATANLESGARASALELAKLAREAQVAEQRLASLRGALAAEQRVLKDTLDAQKAKRQELAAANREVKQAERNQNAYAKAIKDTPETKIAPAARSAAAFIAADLDAAKTKQMSLTAEVNDYKQAVDRSREAIRQIQPQIAAAASQQGKLESQVEKTGASLRRQREDLSKARSGLAEVQTVAQKASATLGGMAASQDTVAAASARMAAELAATKARIDALNKGQGASTSPLGSDATAKEQRRALLEARREWMAAEADVKRLAVAFRSTKQPTEEMGVALGRAQAQARLVKQAYEEQAVAVHRLSGAVQSSFAAFDRHVVAMQRAGNEARVLGTFSNTATAAIRPMAPAAAATGSALHSASGGANAFRGALAGLYGESRQSLSLMQRIRGEVLALTTGYIGIQAALRQIGNVVGAFQTLEAAQSRLGAVFDQDTTQVRKELDFLERNAQRLGISFGVLSNQYAKFAVAADAANFSAESTRKIFLSVAEAGRVNKLSLDQMSGVFLAIEQIISKGKFTSEEVRRQLGDRLPGAFNILADAIGVTTAELDDMMRKGDLLATEENLIKFANQLNSRFGAQLAASLRTTTTEIGRFQDNIYQAQLQVASGGFIDSLNQALAELNEWFRSREGRDFFLTIGAALGRFVEGLAMVPDYFGEIQVAVATFIGFKLAGVFTGIVTSLRQTQGSLGATAASFFTWNGTVRAAQAQVAAFRGTLAPTAGVLATLRSNLLGATAAAGIAGTRFVALQASLSVLRGTVVAVTGAARLMWSVLGGIPGIIFTALTFAFGAWLTNVEDTTRAIDEHKRIMGEVISAYERVTDKTRDWAKEIKNVTLDQANANLREMVKLFEAAREGVKGIDAVDFFSFNALSNESPAQADIARRVQMAKQALDQGTISAAKFVEELQALYAEISDPGLQSWAEALLTAGRSAQQAEIDLGGAAVAAQELGNSSAEVEKIITDTGVSIKTLAETSEKASAAQAKLESDAQKLGEALNGIKEQIPAIAEEMERLNEIDALDKLYQDAVKVARTMGEVRLATELYGRAVDAINLKAFDGTGLEKTVELIKGFEGFRSRPYYDVNAFRVGYGSDTVTLSDGTIQKVTEGIAISQADALRDLVRRIGEFQDVVKTQIGSDRFSSFTEEQQAVLTSIAYNYGSLPERIVDAIKTGTVGDIANAIRGLGGDNGGVNKGRRDTEAGIFQAGGESVVYEAERAAKAKEYNTDLERRLALQTVENENGGKLTREAFVQKAVQDEQNKAKEEGLLLSEAQLAKIREVAGAEYDVKNAKTEQKTEAQAANQALAQANALAAQRAELERQIKDAIKNRDPATAQQLQTELANVNLQLSEAIEKARAMWEAIGGDAAQVALTRLDTLSLKLDKNVSGLTYFGLTANQVGQLAGSFADGFLNIFDQMVQAIGNGENAFKAMGKAFLQFAADFLRQIARMILQQIIFNALRSFGIPVPGVPMGHSGGMVGPVAIGVGNMRKKSAPIGAFAMKYHGGGMVGFAPDEVSAVLRQNEEVLPESDPRHRNNGGIARVTSGMQPAQPQALRIVNVLDEDSAANWLGSPSGERVIMSFMKKNASTVRRIIG